MCQPASLTRSDGKTFCSSCYQYGAVVNPGEPWLPADQRMRAQGATDTERGAHPELVRCSHCRKIISASLTVDAQRALAAVLIADPEIEDGPKLANLVDGDSVTEPEHVALLDELANRQTCNECRETVDSVCSNCDGCESCCESCADCSHCGKRVDSDDVCSNCENCDRCCDCSSCSGCNYRGTEVCGNCDNCYDCCECWTCESCGNEFTSHSDSCDCEDDDGSKGFRFDPPAGLKFWQGKKTKQNPSTRFVAAEVEIAETPGNTTELERVCERWNHSGESDGSLPDRGCEIGMAPAGGSEWVRAVDELCAAVRKADGKVTQSCGLHIHLDARDFDHYGLARLIRVYAGIEDAVYSVIPRSRKTSSYCEPCGPKLLRELNGSDPYGTIANTGGKAQKRGHGKRNRATARKIGRAVYGDANTRYNKRDAKPGCRYRGLNLHSWYYRKTIELRMHGGTVDPVKIKNWGILWSFILDRCNGMTDKQVNDLLAGFTSGGKVDEWGSTTPVVVDSWGLFLSLMPTDELRTFYTARRDHFAGVSHYRDEN